MLDNKSAKKNSKIDKILQISIFIFYKHMRIRNQVWLVVLALNDSNQLHSLC